MMNSTLIKYSSVFAICVDEFGISFPQFINNISYGKYSHFFNTLDTMFFTSFSARKIATLIYQEVCGDLPENQEIDIMDSIYWWVGSAIYELVNAFGVTIGEIIENIPPEELLRMYEPFHCEGPAVLIEYYDRQFNDKLS